MTATPVLERPPISHRDQHRELAPPRWLSDAVVTSRSRILPIAFVFLALAVAAAVNHGWLLAQVDSPISEFIAAHRTSGKTEFFREVSSWGGTRTVFAGGLLLSILAAARCPAVGAALMVATLVRGPIEFVLKLAVSRDRPDFSQLVHGAGYSFPSGHPMAAAVFWGSMPIVLALYWRRRSVWIVSWVVALSMIVLIGYSRVYLGVHWPTDVLAGLLAGILLISGLDWLIQRAGVIPGCSRLHGLGSARQGPDHAPAP